MFSKLNTQPMATSHVLHATDATRAWESSDSSVTASYECNVELANGCAVAECIGQWESDGGFCGDARFARRCAPV